MCRFIQNLHLFRTVRLNTHCCHVESQRPTKGFEHHDFKRKNVSKLDIISWSTDDPTNQPQGLNISNSIGKCLEVGHSRPLKTAGWHCPRASPDCSDAPWRSGTYGAELSRQDQCGDAPFLAKDLLDRLGGPLHALAATLKNLRARRPADASSSC